MITLADFGVTWDRVDAALTSVKWGNVVYFFKGNQYTSWNIDTKTAQGIGPLSAWKLPWDSIDAAARIDWYGNYIYFFKGPYYVRYNEDTGTVGSKQYLTDFEWPWGKVDAAVSASPLWGDAIYFFRGLTYMRVTKSGTSSKPKSSEDNIYGWIS